MWYPSVVQFTKLMLTDTTSFGRPNCIDSALFIPSNVNESPLMNTETVDTRYECETQQIVRIECWWRWKIAATANALNITVLAEIKI